MTLPKIDTPKFLTSFFYGIINYNPATNECYDGSCYFVKKVSYIFTRKCDANMYVKKIVKYQYESMLIL